MAEGDHHLGGEQLDLAREHQAAHLVRQPLGSLQEELAHCLIVPLCLEVHPQQVDEPGNGEMINSGESASAFFLPDDNLEISPPGGVDQVEGVEPPQEQPNQTSHSRRLKKKYIICIELKI